MAHKLAGNQTTAAQWPILDSEAGTYNSYDFGQDRKSPLCRPLQTS
jgi:hypothetical protein